MCTVLYCSGIRNAAQFGAGAVYSTVVVVVVPPSYIL